MHFGRSAEDEVGVILQYERVDGERRVLLATHHDARKVALGAFLVTSAPDQSEPVAFRFVTWFHLNFVASVVWRPVRA